MTLFCEKSWHMITKFAAFPNKCRIPTFEDFPNRESLQMFYKKGEGLGEGKRKGVVYE